MSHLVIAGTGRAGTSFLVRWLAECGLDVGDGLSWDDDAMAGMERRLQGDGLPFVVKDPWLWTYTDEVDLARTPIEALVLPMRQLGAAAASRVRRERAVAGQYAAATHGGMIFELSELDQRRILASGFYAVLFWAVSNGIPVLLPTFPRLVNEAEYCHSVFAQWLPDKDAAVAAHGRIAERRSK